jgi:DNA-directed RNA polymerase II subunit RPB4
MNALNDEILDEDVTELRLGKDFDEATALSNAEVAIIMDQYQKHQREDNKEVGHVFDRTLKCAVRFSGTKDPVANIASVTELRSALEKARFTVEAEGGVEEEAGLEQYEVVALANLAPESVEEAITLIPSLSSRFREEDVEEMLNILRRNTFS